MLGEDVLFKLVARGWAGINCEGERLLAEGTAYAWGERVTAVSAEITALASGVVGFQLAPGFACTDNATRALLP